MYINLCIINDTWSMVLLLLSTNNNLYINIIRHHQLSVRIKIKILSLNSTQMDKYQYYI